MCGIVGLYLKNDALHGQLGELFAPMLTQMSERGPDSAGIAVYREDSNTSRVAGSRQWCKVTIHSALDDPEWPALVQRALEVTRLAAAAGRPAWAGRGANVRLYDRPPADLRGEARRRSSGVGRPFARSGECGFGCRRRHCVIM